MLLLIKFEGTVRLHFQEDWCDSGHAVWLSWKPNPTWRNTGNTKSLGLPGSQLLVCYKTALLENKLSNLIINSHWISWCSLSKGTKKMSFSAQTFEKRNSLQKRLQETSEILNSVRKEAKGSVQTHSTNLKKKRNMTRWSNFECLNLQRIWFNLRSLSHHFYLLNTTDKPSEP